MGKQGAARREPLEGIDLAVTSGVSLFTGAGFCTVFVDGQAVGQMTPAEVRAMTLAWLEAAEAAESDAAVVAELRGLGLDDETVAGFLLALRERRLK